MIGAMAVGLVYGIVSLLICKTGYKWINEYLTSRRSSTSYYGNRS